MCHEIVFFWFFFNIKSIESVLTQSMQKQVVGQIWSMDAASGRNK